eukprot:g53827.t1
MLNFALGGAWRQQHCCRWRQNNLFAPALEVEHDGIFELFILCFWTYILFVATLFVRACRRGNAAHCKCYVNFSPSELLASLQLE